MEEKQKKPMGRPKGSKDKQPRKTEGYAESSPRNLEKARANNPIVQDTERPLPSGYNAKMVSFAMEIMPTEPLDKDNPEHMAQQLMERFENYVKLCAERDVKVGNMGAYLAMGISRDDVYRWVTLQQANPLVIDILKKVQHYCAYIREGLMQDGKVNPVTGIFWQKNYDGLKDQQEVVVTPNNPLGESQDAESLRKKYLESTYNIVEGAETPALPEKSEN